MRGVVATVTGFAWRELLGGGGIFNRAVRLRSRDTLGVAPVLGPGPSAWCARNGEQGARRPTDSRRPGRAGRPQPAERRTGPAGSSGYRWALIGVGRRATGQASSGLAWPGPSAGRGEGSDRGRQRPRPELVEPHRPRPTRTDRAGAGGQEEEGRGARRCRPAPGPRRKRPLGEQAGDPPHGSISGRGTGAGRCYCDVQRGCKSLFVGEGLGIGEAAYGPSRPSAAVDLHRRRRKPMVWA